MSKVFINEDTLIGIGNAIREKTGKTELIPPLSMATEISSITTGGGELPEEAFVLTGECGYRFYNGNWDWFLRQYGNKITTDALKNTHYMFYFVNVDTIPFELNIKNTEYYSMSSMFYGSSNLKELPKINNAYPYSIQYLFANCKSLREIPENYFDTWNFNRIHTYQYSQINSIFQGMYSLRKIPQRILEPLWSIGVSGSYTPYQSMFEQCYVLDEINGVAVQPVALTANRFNNTFSMCHRVKNITFQVNEDGSPKTANWKNQLIDLTNYIGYVYNESVIINYNSGITQDKKVIDDITYQSLKDDPDWYSLKKPEYSRYNHDSAVNTINSLPDTSAYGTNTIKFKGSSGSKTDGGAINTLTEEEIAVATAKGWTVSLV